MPRPPRTLKSVPPSDAGASTDSERGDRLQKALAAAGVGSRRHCEELITAGRVEIDRRVVTKLGTRVNTEEQEIRVDGVRLRTPKLVYRILNKPRGVLSTNDDPSGRPRVIDLVGPGKERLYPVGRLDMESEGLILVTNDGELANRLTHPRYGVEKAYVAEVAGQFSRDDLLKLRKGAVLAEGFARPTSAKIKSNRPKSTLLEIVLAEGRNREIRRLLARLGHKVMRLKRVAIGPVRLGDMEPGESRALSHSEVRSLRFESTPEAARKRLRARHARSSRSTSQPGSPSGGEGSGEGNASEPTRKPAQKPAQSPARSAAKPPAHRPAKPSSARPRLEKKPLRKRSERPAAPLQKDKRVVGLGRHEAPTGTVIGASESAPATKRRPKRRKR